MDLSKLIALAGKIDSLDYYQVLGLKRNATAGEIRKAYHQRARAVHPDLFYEHPNEEFCYAIDKIFKRVTESYMVLRDEQKRSFYDQGLQGPDRKLRYGEEQERARRDAKKDEMGKTPQGRKLYEKAVGLQNEGKLRQAIQTLQMAIGFEGKNNHFQELLQQWKEEASSS